jgi:hypothetical protein
MFLQINLIKFIIVLMNFKSFDLKNLFLKFFVLVDMLKDICNQMVGLNNLLLNIFKNRFAVIITIIDVAL